LAILNSSNSRRSKPFTWLLVFVLIAAIGYSFTYEKGEKKDTTDVSISQIQTAYQNPDSGLIKIEILNNDVIAEFSDGRLEKAYKEPYVSSVDLGFVGRENVVVTVTSEESKQFWMDVLFTVLPFVLLFVLAIFLLKNIAGANKSAMSFGQSGARPMDKNGKKTTFADVAGSKEAKHELEEIADFLRTPKKYTQMGAKIPKGVLLVGAPGTGKTLMARAVAGEANVPFFSISGSEFVEMFVGVGASRVRDLFKKAKKNSPCIVFIDELDAVGRQRGAGLGGGHDEREQTLNQILTEMDGFEKEESVIVLAATNRPDVLDPALMRPGRFDRHVTMDKPDLHDRLEILKVHARKKPIDKSADLNIVAGQTAGFVGAELENLLNESAILAARANRKVILQEDLSEALEKVLMGPEKRGRAMNEEERRTVAYHEAGHAVVGHFMPLVDPVHKISIISRGMALGVTWFMPKEDRRLISENKFRGELASLLGGRVAEEIFFKDVTTGASNDLERATKIAREMVTRYGMSALGNLTFGDHKGSVFLGKDFMHERNYSEDTAKKIDAEVDKIVKQAHVVAKNIVLKYKKYIDKIAQELLKKETLNRDEFEKMLPKVSLNQKK